MKIYLTALSFLIAGIIAGKLIDTPLSSANILKESTACIDPLTNDNGKFTSSHTKIESKPDIVTKRPQNRDLTHKLPSTKLIRVIEENERLQNKIDALENKLLALNEYQTMKNSEKRMDAILEDAISLKSNYSKEIRSRFNDQEIDPEWASNNEGQLYELFLNDTYLKALSVNSYECRTTQCRIEIQQEDSAVENELLTHLSQLARDGKLGSKETSFLILPNDGSGMNEIYFTSTPEGFSLSDL